MTFYVFASISFNVFHLSVDRYREIVNITATKAIIFSLDRCELWRVVSQRPKTKN